MFAQQLLLLQIYALTKQLNIENLIMKEEERTDLPEKASNVLNEFQAINEDGDIFKQMFKYSVIPTIIHDMEMNIIDANDSALEEFGYSYNEFKKNKYIRSPYR